MKPANLSTVRKALAENPQVRKSAFALLASNAVPLLGVVLFRWDLFTIMFLFWFENVIIGVINVPKIVMACGAMKLGKSPQMPAGAAEGLQIGFKIMGIPFFIVHYGMFTAVHGMFVFVMFSGRLPLMNRGPFPAPEMVLPHIAQLIVPILAIIASHVVSFITNFIGQEEYRTISAPEQMFAPYGRIVVLHLVILFGGFAVMLLGAPWAAVALLVVLKTGLDLSAHVSERMRAEVRKVKGEGW